MNYGEIMERIKQIAAEQLDVPYNQLAPQTRFVDDLEADSLDLAELSMEVEDEFDLEIPEDDPLLYTVRDLANYVAKELHVDIPEE